MIYIVDYGLGNIKAFVNVYERLNVRVNVAKSAEEIKKASKIILPGVGAFDQAMKLLNNSGMRDALDIQVLENKIPIVGVCVGMQILAKSSEEGLLPGLGWINGYVKKFDVSDLSMKPGLPHMGWNTINPNIGNPLMSQFCNQPKFYFLHSYYLYCSNKDDAIATSEYGIKFTSAVNEGNIYGVQFHPEKSHINGIKLLNNFAEL